MGSRRFGGSATGGSSGKPKPWHFSLGLTERENPDPLITVEIWVGNEHDSLFLKLLASHSQRGSSRYFWNSSRLTSTVRIPWCKLPRRPHKWGGTKLGQSLPSSVVPSGTDLTFFLFLCKLPCWGSLRGSGRGPRRGFWFCSLGGSKPGPWGRPRRVCLAGLSQTDQAQKGAGIPGVSGAHRGAAGGGTLRAALPKLHRRCRAPPATRRSSRPWAPTVFNPKASGKTPSPRRGDHRCLGLASQTSAGVSRPFSWPHDLDLDLCQCHHR